jgi:hypothetical protein
MSVDKVATMFEDVDNSLAQWQEKLINSKEVVFTTSIKMPPVLAEVTMVTAETLATLCSKLHSLVQGGESESEKLAQCHRMCMTALRYMEVQQFAQTTNTLAGMTLDERWKEMRTMHTHLCKKTQLYKWLELGCLVRRPNLQYQAVLMTHNAFRKTIKSLSKVQPLVKAFAEMIPADSRLNWGPYDLHTDRFTVMQMPANLIAAMDKLLMCKLVEQTRNRGSPVAMKSKKMDENHLQLLVGLQEKSPLRSFLENVATPVKQEVASPELVFKLGYAMLSLENGDEQERHNDCDDAIFDQIGRPLERGNMPLSVLASLQEGTKLIIWRGAIGPEPIGSFTRMQLTLKRGEILVFRGDLDHAGASYKQENFRAFLHLDHKRAPQTDREDAVAFITNLKVIDGFSQS